LRQLLPSELLSLVLPFIAVMLFYLPVSMPPCTHASRIVSLSLSLFICYDKLNVCLYPFHRASLLDGALPVAGGSVYSQTQVNEPYDTISCAKSPSLCPSSCFSPEAASAVSVPSTGRCVLNIGVSPLLWGTAWLLPRRGFALPLRKRLRAALLIKHVSPI